MPNDQVDLPATPPEDHAPRAAAAPEPAARRNGVSRGWMIGGIAAGAIVVLGLTFGGGIATGLAIGDHRGGFSAEQGGPGMHGPGQQWGGDDGRQGPDRGTPPLDREGSRDDGSNDDGSNDETSTPAPTPNS